MQICGQEQIEIATDFSQIMMNLSQGDFCFVLAEMCLSDLISFWKTATLKQGELGNLLSLVQGKKNSLEFVQAKGSRVPAAHTCTHPKISKVPLALGKSEIYIQITLCKFVDKNNS